MAVWDRMEDESSKAYEAFCAYRDLGPQRSVAKAVKNYVETTETKRRTKQRWWLNWSKKHSWVARVTAYDDYIELEQRKVQEQEKREMVRRHAQLSLMMQQKGIQRLQSLDVNEVAPGSLARLLEVAVKIEREARGEPGEIQRQEHAGGVLVEHEVDLDKLSNDEVATLVGLLKKAKDDGQTATDVPGQSEAVT